MITSPNQRLYKLNSDPHTDRRQEVFKLVQTLSLDQLIEAYHFLLNDRVVWGRHLIETGSTEYSITLHKQNYNVFALTIITKLINHKRKYNR